MARKVFDAVASGRQISGELKFGWVHSVRVAFYSRGMMATMCETVKR